MLAGVPPEPAAGGLTTVGRVVRAEVKDRNCGGVDGDDFPQYGTIPFSLLLIFKPPVEVRTLAP